MQTTNSLSRRTVLGAFAATGFSGKLLAQGTQPVKIVLGVPPGSSTDVVARILGNALSPLLGQAVIIDNKPGASGSIATSSFLASPHDGQTWLMAVNGFFTEAPHTVKTKFDALKETKLCSTLVGAVWCWLAMQVCLPRICVSWWNGCGHTNRRFRVRLTVPAPCRMCLACC
ncbi:MAG: hypothetical protein IPG42_03490 [Betaproteobacteria bacterium]|nr:hypothetical protein [Betaproteobacteria bacterium]